MAGQRERVGIAPEVILGAVKDKTRHEEECHQGHQENQ